MMLISLCYFVQLFSQVHCCNSFWLNYLTMCEGLGLVKKVLLTSLVKMYQKVVWRLGSARPAVGVYSSPLDWFYLINILSYYLVFSLYWHSIVLATVYLYQY